MRDYSRRLDRLEVSRDHGTVVRIIDYTTFAPEDVQAAMTLDNERIAAQLARGLQVNVIDMTGAKPGAQRALL
jgi:hypothetical protein